MNHINLETFAGGKFSEQVNKAMEEVTRNIQNPNTDATAVRKMTVTITLKPNEARNFIATSIVTKATLAPEIGITTAMNMGEKPADRRSGGCRDREPGARTDDNETGHRKAI